MRDVIPGPNDIKLLLEVSGESLPFHRGRSADSSTLTPTSTPGDRSPWGKGHAYLYCQLLALPPRPALWLLLLLLLIPPPQLLLLLFLFGVAAGARPSSFPSLSGAFMEDTGSTPCILTPKSTCPSSGDNSSAVLWVVIFFFKI